MMKHLRRFLFFFIFIFIVHYVIDWILGKDFSWIDCLATSIILALFFTPTSDLLKDKNK